jgi:nucleoid-associated protein YgaU
MPNDAKLGLIFGVSFVIALGVVYFRPDVGAHALPTTVAVTATPPASAPRGGQRPVPARRASRAIESADRKHTVQEGETLAGLAQRYYGDSQKTTEILRVNRDIVQNGDQLTPGTVLTIPEQPGSDMVAGESSAPTP